MLHSSKWHVQDTAQALVSGRNYNFTSAWPLFVTPSARWWFKRTAESLTSLDTNSFQLFIFFQPFYTHICAHSLISSAPFVFFPFGKTCYRVLKYPLIRGRYKPSAQNCRPRDSFCIIYFNDFNLSLFIAGLSQTSNFIMVFLPGCGKNFSINEGNDSSVSRWGIAVWQNKNWI